jgi:mRNA-degrading endonuclease RelE of RelBE toxin-antitoxin system
MAAYELIVKPSVEKDLRAMSKPMVKRLLERMDQLKEVPFARQAAKCSGDE